MKKGLMILSALILVMSVPACVAGTSKRENKEVSGQVLDQEGRPVSGARVSRFWRFSSGRLVAEEAFTTGLQGTFKSEIRPGDQPVVLMAVSTDQTRGGLVVLDSDTLDQPVRIAMEPLVRVHGTVSIKGSRKKPDFMNVMCTRLPARMMFTTCYSQDGSFALLVPPGSYRFWTHAKDLQRTTLDLVVPGGKKEMDLGNIELGPNFIDEHKGKPLPEWTVTAARGVKKSVQLSDFKGKWVLVEFWGYW